ncbi:MAG: hypothetical protein WAK26_11620 [Terracidiphilus sp.]
MSSGLFTRFFFWPEWWLYGASPLMLEVGEGARPIGNTALSPSQSLPRGFQFAFSIAHTSSQSRVELLAFVHG